MRHLILGTSFPFTVAALLLTPPLAPAGGCEHMLPHRGVEG